MKKTLLKHTTLAGAAALLLAGASMVQAQVPVTNIISTFDTGSQGVQPTGCGAWYGSYTAGWDGTVDDTGNGGGSLYVQSIFGSGSDTPLTEFVCLPGDNLWWPNNGSFNASSYQTLDFDLKWDKTSVLTIPQFNDPSTVPTNLLQSWATYGYMAGSTPGLEVDFCWQGNGDTTFLAFTNIPTAASNGWVHISIPINPTLANIDPSVGIIFKKWLNQQWGMIDASTATANFWVDNVMLIGTTAPPPPPKLVTPVKATQGLNIFSSTEGNSFYDRQEAELMQNSGLSWVGQATPSTPVTYSFDIVGYPNSYNCEAYLFLSPNPAGNDGAPDWNETNCAIFYLQGNASTAQAFFQYKVNEPGQGQMYGAGGAYTNKPGSWDGVTTPYLESGSLATFHTSVGIYGQWILKFTSDTNGTIIAPDGSSTNFVIPPYNIGYFAETATPAFHVYLGMQANAADGMNQPVVYSYFAVSNTASPFYENFLADTALDTVNVWRTSVATGPKGVLIVPTNEWSWVKWSLPDTGFSLQTSPVLNNALDWTAPTNGPILPLYGYHAQLVASNEVPAGPTAFFQLLKRIPTQLQVLMPGEVNAPNTPTGKTGTPLTTLTSSDEVDVTINLVDATFHIMNSSDQVSLTSNDGGVVFGTATPALVNGTVTEPAYFDSGTWTVTATDTSSTNITAGTSSPITIQ
jgi:hypothetical protein